MAESVYCRTCLARRDLSSIFPTAEHHGKVSQVILEATGVHITYNDSHSQLMCATCIITTNDSYKFRRTCQQIQLTLNEKLHQKVLDIDQGFISPNTNTKIHIDISDLLDCKLDNSISNFLETKDLDNNINMTLDDFSHDSFISAEIVDGDHIHVAQTNAKKRKNKCKDTPMKRVGHPRRARNSNQDTSATSVTETTINIAREKSPPLNAIEKTTDTPQISVKKTETSTPQTSVKEMAVEGCPSASETAVERSCASETAVEGGHTSASETAVGRRAKGKEHIECSLCHKVLTSRLSLRNHNKIHTGFDIVCEHCGKRFITRRLLLMHCKAKHGYEKTDKCRYCDYRASNAEQVKIHERLHTGERPFSCGAASCGARFVRRSTLRTHEATHLQERTVPCAQCPLRFKSVSLMRVHLACHRARARAADAQWTCGLCARVRCAWRRDVARHLRRAHGTNDSAHIRAVRADDAQG